MNIKNVKKLLAHLVKQQKSRKAARFNMRYWGNQCLTQSSLSDVLKVPVCKTQACLAGETVLALKAGKVLPDGGIELFDYPDTGDTYISREAQGLLELTEDERHRLFRFRSWGIFASTPGWPTKFENDYKQAKTPAKRLGVAIARVKHFIKTNGQE